MNIVHELQVVTQIIQNLLKHKIILKNVIKTEKLLKQ